MKVEVNLKHCILVGVVMLSLQFALVSPAFAGAPYPPNPVSPPNGSTTQDNPPTLCGNVGQGDPDGDTVQIKFEAHDGGSIGHISPWLNVDGNGNVCWTDSSPWNPGTTAWAVRALAGGEQSGASGEWTVTLPQLSQPQETCQVVDLYADISAPQPIGTTVTFTINASCTNGVSKIKVFVDGSKVDIIQGGSGTFAWNTSGVTAGNHVVSVEVAGNGGGSASRSHPYDLTEGSPPATPQVTCSISNVTVSPTSPQPSGTVVIISAQATCNTGLRAMRLLVNGGQVWEDGGFLNAHWNTSGLADGDYKLVVQAAGVGDNNWKQADKYELDYMLSSSSSGGNAPTCSISQFSTGDVLWNSQNGNVYVIYYGQLRHVPNPETLDALGKSRASIDNKSCSNYEIENILPHGLDIPDINVDPVGFQAFKNEVFPNTAPIVPGIPGEDNGASSGNDCPSAPARLKPGDIAVVSDFDPSPLLVWNDSRTDGGIKFRVPIREMVSVISGPRCGESRRWFEIGYQGNSGWAVEVSKSGAYNLIPNGLPLPGGGMITPNARPQQNNGVVVSSGRCDGAEPPRMTIGGYGAVPSGNPSNFTALTEKPQGTILMNVPAGGVFQVLDGPVCTDAQYGHLNWWKVDYQGTVGWMPEGYAFGDYWIEPTSNVLSGGSQQEQIKPSGDHNQLSPLVDQILKANHKAYEAQNSPSGQAFDNVSTATDMAEISGSALPIPGVSLLAFSKSGNTGVECISPYNTSGSLPCYQFATDVSTGVTGSLLQFAIATSPAWGGLAAVGFALSLLAKVLLQLK